MKIKKKKLFEIIKFFSVLMIGLTMVLSLFLPFLSYSYK